MAAKETFLHHNRGVKALKFTIRQDREIKSVETKKFNAVVKSPEETFLLTKGDCELAAKLGRIKLQAYAGNWPRCALIWKRIKEVIND